MALALGMIGCGRMAHELAAVIRDAVPEAQLVAGFDPFTASREAFCATFGAEPCDLLEALLNRDDIGAILVASPNYLHAEHTIAAAATGKHVFCEKPMALAVKDCEAMIAACQAHGVKLMVGHSMRLAPPLLKLGALIASGELGRPLHGIARYWFSGFQERESGVWHVMCAQSGGLFYQMAIHQIDVFNMAFGPALRVHYAGGQYGAQVRDFNDLGTVLVEYESGATGAISACGFTSLASREMTILFRQGYAKLEGPWGRMEYGRDPDHCTVIEADQFDGPGGVERELVSFADWVQHGTPPVLTAAEGRAAVAVAEAADRARAAGGSAAV
jgi:phthalate 4,5-cis-dihydrodiol dehydrogenase